MQGLHQSEGLDGLGCVDGDPAALEVGLALLLEQHRQDSGVGGVHDEQLAAGGLLDTDARRHIVVPGQQRRGVDSGGTEVVRAAVERAGADVPGQGEHRAVLAGDGAPRGAVEVASVAAAEARQVVEAAREVADVARHVAALDREDVGEARAAAQAHGDLVVGVVVADVDDVDGGAGVALLEVDGEALHGLGCHVPRPDGDLSADLALFVVLPAADVPGLTAAGPAHGTSTDQGRCRGRETCGQNNPSGGSR